MIVGDDAANVNSLREIVDVVSGNDIAKRHNGQRPGTDRGEFYNFHVVCRGDIDHDARQAHITASDVICAVLSRYNPGHIDLGIQQILESARAAVQGQIDIPSVDEQLRPGCVEVPG